MFATPKQTGRASLFGRTPLHAAASGRRSLQPTPRSTPGIANRCAECVCATIGNTERTCIYVAVSCRSLRAEQVLEETALHVVKALNAPVPVQVQEALRGNLRGKLINNLCRSPKWVPSSHVGVGSSSGKSVE